MPFSYQSFGFRISSDFECPELLPQGGEADVRFKFGSVPSLLPESQPIGVSCAAASGKCLIDIPNIARYLVRDGLEISVQTAESADISAIRLFLLGTAMGALLHQRRLLPLHGSAISTSRGAVAFIGASGTGKSTVAGAFALRGYEILGDDICAVDTGGSVSVVRGSPYLMLWKDALDQLGLLTRDYRRVREGLEKYFLPVPSATTLKPIPLHAIYVLEPQSTSDFTLSPIRGLGRLQVLAHNTFRQQFVEPMGLSPSHSDLVMGTARAGRIVRVQFPRRGTGIGNLADLLERDFSV